MLDQAFKFQTDGEPVFCNPYGYGHINSTFLMEDSRGRQYILQKINRNVFREPRLLMENLAAVVAHLQKTAVDRRSVLSLIPTEDGAQWLVDDDGEYWRMQDFIRDSICIDRAETAGDLRESALAFGDFQRRLANFPVHTLAETIPHFHDTPLRYAALHSAAEADAHGRAAKVRREIEFLLEREDYASTLTALQASGDLPLRVTHNDAKLNNVLFDRRTRRAICVVDLDTVMPGLSVNDFGDSIRYGASSAVEDERDISKVELLLPSFEAYSGGFLSACGNSLTECEILHLRDGAKMMTLESGVRFLTDYLAGDKYFATSREGHNLDRCRTQLKLVADMELHWEEMRRILTRLISPH